MAQLLEALPYKPERRGFDLPMVLFFVDVILPAALWPRGSTQFLTEKSTRNISWKGEGGSWPVRRADNFTNFMCRLSLNLGASTSWNPQGLSRRVK